MSSAAFFGAVVAKMQTTLLIHNLQIEYNETNHFESKITSPGSPERQYCSSTTQPHTESGLGLMEVSNSQLNKKKLR